MEKNYIHEPSALQTLSLPALQPATAVGPLVIGVAHDAGASYSSVLLGIAVATACFGFVSLLLLQAPQRRPARASLAEATPEPVRIVTGKSMEPERLRV